MMANSDFSNEFQWKDFITIRYTPKNNKNGSYDATIILKSDHETMEFLRALKYGNQYRFMASMGINLTDGLHYWDDKLLYPVISIPSTFQKTILDWENFKRKACKRLTQEEFNVIFDVFDTKDMDKICDAFQIMYWRVDGEGYESLANIIRLIHEKSPATSEYIYEEEMETIKIAFDIMDGKLGANDAKRFKNIMEGLSKIYYEDQNRLFDQKIYSSNE